MSPKKDYVIVVDRVIGEGWFSGASDEDEASPYVPSTEDPLLAVRYQDFTEANAELKALVSEYPSTRFRLDVLEPITDERTDEVA
jgi:hypothetical protein